MKYLLSKEMYDANEGELLAEVFPSGVADADIEFVSFESMPLERVAEKYTDCAVAFKSLSHVLRGRIVGTITNYHTLCISLDQSSRWAGVPYDMTNGYVSMTSKHPVVSPSDRFIGARLEWIIGIIQNDTYSAIDWPHTCPRCGKPALNMAVRWDCVSGCWR